MSDNKALGSMSLFSQDGGMEHYDDGVHFLRLWANMCIIETEDGVVIYDTGFEFTGPRLVKELREITDKPVHYIIYGHGHADHAFGTNALYNDAEERGRPRPVVIAHENCPKRFDRYREMLPYHEHINRIQFAIPDNLPAFAQRYYYPDMTFRDEMTLHCGGLTFELKAARGETDDAVWMWLPERKTVCVSDLWVWSCPNIGNPFKVQRYETEWADALEAIAGKSPELLLPGHGIAIQGADEIKQALTTVAKALRHLHNQVVAMLNKGMWQEEILQSFDWPDEFAESKYLQAVYGHPHFIAQAILRRYHGWYDGNPSHLFPSSSAEIAREIAALVGDDSKLLERAKNLGKDDNPQLALHLLDFVIDAGGELKNEALSLKTDMLQKIADKEKSFIARNIFLGGVRQVRNILGN